MLSEDAERDVERLIGAAQDAVRALERVLEQLDAPDEDLAFSRCVAVQMRERFDAEVRRIRELGHPPMPHDRIQAFVFRLARDNVVPGIIEENVRVIERNHGHAAQPGLYSGEGAQLLGRWAAHIAKRLIGDTP